MPRQFDLQHIYLYIQHRKKFMVEFEGRTGSERRRILICNCVLWWLHGDNRKLCIISSNGQVTMYITSLSCAHFSCGPAKLVRGSGFILNTRGTDVAPNKVYYYYYLLVFSDRILLGHSVEPLSRGCYSFTVLFLMLAVATTILKFLFLLDF